MSLFSAPKVPLSALATAGAGGALLFVALAMGLYALGVLPGYPEVVGTVAILLATAGASALIATRASLRRHRTLAAELERRVDELRSMFDNAPVGMAIRDLDGRYVRVNEVAAEFLGKTDLVGKTLEEVWPPDVAGAIRRADRKILEGGLPLRSEERLPDIADPRDFLSVRCPVRDAGGTIVAIALFLIDIDDQKTAERSLRESEARLRDFATAASDWFWETDADGRFVHSYEHYERQDQRSFPSLIGRTRQEVAGEEQIAAEPEKWRAHRETLEARRPFRDFEYEVRASSGERRAIAVSGIPYFDDDGAFLGYRGTARDITQMRAAERSLRKQQDLQRQLIDSVPAWLAYVDKELRYQFANARFGQTRWLAGRDIIGKHLSELVPPEVLAGMKEHFEAAFRGRTDVFESVRPMSDGSERHFRIHYVPHFGDDGEVDGVFILGEDLTELTNMKDRLRSQADQLRLVADGVPGAVVYIDAEHRYRFVNRVGEERQGRPAAEIHGRHYREMWGEEVYRRSLPYIERALAGEEVSFEDVRTLPGGEERVLHMTYMPHREPDGTVKGLIGLSLDITERKMLEDQLRHTQKMDAVGKLTGGVAHDFNNLMLAIQTNLELLDETFEAGDDRQDFVHKALRGVERAADLTRRLLAFSRRQPLAPESIDVGALVSDAVTMLRRTLEETVEITTEIGESGLVSKVDAGQLESALLNLAVNARDAMPSGGRLSIAVDQVEVPRSSVVGRPHTAGPYVRIRVGDTGTGMSETISSRAFEPFFTTKEAGHGTGLGLSMVHGFVEQSGGFCEIESQPGDGTEVSLYLPRATGQDVRPQEDSRPAISTGSGRVLLVEDDPLVREAAADMLGNLGYEVESAGSGSEAREILGTGSPFDLVFSDIVMPGGVSGIELAEAVRRERPGLPVILATGYADAIAEGRSVEGLARLILKPYSRAELASAIEDVLEDEAA